VKKVYFGLGVSDFIGVFLFEVVPSEDEQERYHWVVAGDVPPARLSMTDYPNLAVALKGYIQEMRERCSTALTSGKGNAAHEHELMRRMQLVDREILSLYREELSQDGFDEGIVSTKQLPLPSIPSEGPTLPRSSVAASRTIASPRPAPGTSCAFPR